MLPQDNSAGKRPPLPPEVKMKILVESHASPSRWFTLPSSEAWKIWNSLLAGNAAWKSPGELRLMINLPPIAQRLSEADGEKVGRSLFTRVPGAFSRTVGQVFSSLLAASVLVNRWEDANLGKWTRWAPIPACVRAARAEVVEKPALQGVEIWYGWWKLQRRNGQKGFRCL